eukprot:Blabericola_migrator_1__8157@NODE_420_length_8669_cov_118_779354_g332_i0_p2_GENE_NODE_420_length_8669_cov_118_779354_g332_i0NODE_420_length_8669_cov_118_779354_g332_i0_p2_ORF_typecomplete_len356_score51_18Pur_DNA_glyco/PF02245_16/2_3e37_NODE_420_length_8669_cov_118_779354_g332_i019633030
MQALPESFFTEQSSPTEAAKSLLGKLVWVSRVVDLGGLETESADPEESNILVEVVAGQILETEGYGANDMACHARLYRRTPSNNVLFESGGHAYIYRCHNHHLLNISFAHEGEPTCVLIRAVTPVVNASLMVRRRRVNARIKGHQATLTTNNALTQVGRGPGNLTVALGLDKDYYGFPVFDKVPSAEEAKVGRLWISEAPKSRAHLLELRDSDDTLTWTEPGTVWSLQSDSWTVAVSPRIGIASAGDDATKMWRFYMVGHKAVSTGPMVWPDGGKNRLIVCAEVQIPEDGDCSPRKLLEEEDVKCSGSDSFGLMAGKTPLTDPSDEDVHSHQHCAKKRRVQDVALLDQFEYEATT